MIRTLRTDGVEFREVRRCAISINADDLTNTTRRVIMVKLIVDKPANERAFNRVIVEGALSDSERDEVHSWAEHILRGPVKVTMSV